MIDSLPTVDLVVLSRDERSLHPQVEQGIACQNDVRVIVHRVFGKPLEQDLNRWSVIARARNEGKRRGSSSRLMFLDDDVALAPHCVRQLFDGLQERPYFAALGADYLGENQGRICCPHVAMGAVLFRRSALNQFEFRWSEGCCECLCCCRDLRRRHLGIGYLPNARATHLSIEGRELHYGEAPVNQNTAGRCQIDALPDNRAVVMTAFDRHHARKFHHRFLSSLRASGNEETVFAFAYGLYPSDQRTIERLPGVRLTELADNGVAVALRRLSDFQKPLESLPPDTPVAYWDAGDVIFQDRLAELWATIAAHPDRILIVREKAGPAADRVVDSWIRCIVDPGARQRAADMMAGRAFLNSGFVAATAKTMLTYLKAADELLHSTALRGVKHWGDQLAANLYCHTNGDRFLPADERWNYCLFARDPDELHLSSAGRFVRRDGKRLSVVHGNGFALTQFAYGQGPLALASHSTRMLV